MKVHTLRKIKLTLVFGMIIVVVSGCELFQLQFPQNTSEVDRPPESIVTISPLSGTAVASASRTTDSEAVVTLLRYSRFITDLNEVELQKEFEKIQGGNKVESSARSLLKLAVLLSLQKPSFHDDNKAQKLLSDFIAKGKENTPALREYAHMLLANLKQRKDHIKLTGDLHQQLDRERKQKKQLQNKLDALKTIEKSISIRKKEVVEVEVAKPQ